MTLLGRGGHHDGNVKDLSDRGVCDHRVAVERGVEVSGQVEEALLDVEDQEQLSSVLATAHFSMLNVRAFGIFVDMPGTLAITELFDHRLYPMHRLRVDGL